MKSLGQHCLLSFVLWREGKSRGDIPSGAGCRRMANLCFSFHFPPPHIYIWIVELVCRPLTQKILMSLLELQREAFVADLKRYRASHRHLIVDDTTYPIIQKLFNDDILNFVYTFKKIDGDRSKNRDSAIYLLDPTRNYTINCLAADFANGQRYNDAIVMFLPGPWDLFWPDLLKNKYFTDSLIIQKDPHIADYFSFVPIESRLFVTGNNHSIPAYYKPEKHGKNFYHYQIDMAVNAMMGLCTLTNEYPTIRYYNSPISKELAIAFQYKLDEYYRDHPDIIPLNNKTIFLITDRTMDMFGPICHYQFYRSQIFDLLDDVEIERTVEPIAKYSYNIQTGEGRTKKTLIFDSKDPIYTELKDLTIEKATARIRELYSELKVEDSKFSGKNLETANGLRHALVNKDSHAERKTFVTGHYNLCETMWTDLKKEHVGDIITFENLCAAGLGSIDRIKVPVTDGLLHLLNNDGINVYNKIRLLILYAIYRRGVIKNDLKKLLMFSMPEKTDNVIKLFENLQSLGLYVLKPDLSHPGKKKYTYFGVNDTDDQMKIYTPTFTNIISRLVYNKLPEYYNTSTLDTTGYIDEDDDTLKSFPFVKAGPNPTDMEGVETIRNQPKWKSTKNSNNSTRQKIIIFCAGGLTPSELSCISSLEDELNRNIIIGTDEVYSVWDMLGDINLINEDEFDFPLKKKLARKPIPDFLAEDSVDPKKRQTAAKTQQDVKQNVQQSKNSNTSNVQQSPTKHHHKISFGIHSRKKSDIQVENNGHNGFSEVEENKKAKKSMMKKFKKFGI